MAEKFDNPNYNPESGMKYLATHFEMFKPEVAKAMIADAKRKGVKIPPVVEAKARKAGILNAARNAKFKVGDQVVFKANGHRGEVKKIDGGKIGVRWVLSSSVEWHNEDELQKSANSVRNAKFKVGDKVKFKNLFKPERGEETGVVTGYDTDGSVLIRDDDGIKVKASEKLVRLANSVRNAKFKVGDRVKVTWYPDGQKKGIVGKTGELLRISSEGTALVEIDGHEYFTDRVYLTLANSVRTTNAVVAKAINAVVDKALNAVVANARWVILYRDGRKEKIEAPTHDAAKRIADERSRKSGRGYISVIVDDGVDYGVNAVRSANSVVAKAIAMNGAKEKWGDLTAKMLKEKNGWQLWEGPHGYEMHRSNGHGGVGWGKVSRAAAIKHFDKFVADPIRTPLTINAVRNAWADAPDAATAKRESEQTLRKATEIAKSKSGAKATYKFTPNDTFWCGYIDLMFKTAEEAKKYDPYYLFNDLGDNKSILPKWSWGISGFNYKVMGNVVRIFVGHLAT